MQSFSQFGFKVEPYFSTTQLQYENLKTNLEKIGHAAEKMPNGIGAVILEDGKHWLTVYKNNLDVRIGIYNTVNKAIITDIVLGYPELTDKKCDTLSYRIEMYSIQNTKMKHAAIESAWEKALQVNPPAQEIKQER